MKLSMVMNMLHVTVYYIFFKISSTRAPRADVLRSNSHLPNIGIPLVNEQLDVLPFPYSNTPRPTGVLQTGCPSGSLWDAAKKGPIA